MWAYECSLIEEPHLQELARQYEDAAYSCSGGVPFYSKDFGAHLLKFEEPPTEPMLDSVAEVVDTLNYVDKTALYKLIVDPSNVGSIELKTLYNLGIVDKKTNCVVIGNLIEYVKSELHSSDGYKIPTTYSIVDEITELIANINDTVYNKGYEYI